MDNSAAVQFNRYKEMQQQFEQEKQDWEEQQGKPPTPQAGVQRMAYQFGSVFGSVRKAMQAGVTSQGGGVASLSESQVLPPRSSADGAERRTVEERASRMPVRLLFAALQ